MRVISRLLFLVCVIFACLQLTQVNANESVEQKHGWLSSITGKLFGFLAKSPEDGSSASRTVAVEGGVTSTDPAGVSSTISEEEAQQRMETNVTTLLNEKNFEKAIEELAQILDGRPDFLPAHSVLGAILLSLQQFETAETFLFNAVRLSNWSDYASVVNLATVLRQNGDKELALKTVLKGWQTAKNAGTETRALAAAFGDCYMELGNYKSAAEWYLAAAVAYENDGELWLKASTLRFPPSHQDRQAAENVLVTAVSKNENNPDLLNSLGLTLFNNNKVKEAIVLYEQVLRMDAQNNNALLAIATAHHSIMQTDAALHYYDIALKRLPDNVTLLANCAMLLNSLNRKQDALVMIQRAYALDPNNADVQRVIRDMNLEVRK